ncbi:hypothetical protein H5410_021469, partial [Solanum commersonii]
MTPKDGADKLEEYLQIFIHSSVPATLVKLCVSPFVTTKQHAHGCNSQFIDSCKTFFANPVIVYRQFAPILFEFSNLAAMMEWYVHDAKCVLRLHDVFLFVRKLATRLSLALELSVQSVYASGKVCNTKSRSILQSDHFKDLRLKACIKLESQPGLVNKERGETIVRCLSWYLLILKKLENISKLYKGLEEMFWENLRQIRVGLCFNKGGTRMRSFTKCSFAGPVCLKNHLSTLIGH